MSGVRRPSLGARQCLPDQTAVLCSMAWPEGSCLTVCAVQSESPWGVPQQLQFPQTSPAGSPAKHTCVAESTKSSSRSPWPSSVLPGLPASASCAMACSSSSTSC